MAAIARTLPVPLWLWLLPVVLGWATIAPCQEKGDATPRSLLELYGIEGSDLDRFADGESFGPGDHESLLKILYAFPRLPLPKLETWANQTSVAWDSAVAEPSRWRGQVQRVAGKVTSLQRIPVLPEVTRRLGFPFFYQVTLELPGEGSSPARRAVILAREVPEAWLGPGLPLGEQAAALAFLVKSGSQESSTGELIWAAERVAWLPNQPRPEWQIGADQVLLAQRGFDLGLLDQARHHNKQPLSAHDREVFYQLLAAVDRGPAQDFWTPTLLPLGLPELLGDPERYAGRLVQFQGIARRAVRVLVPDSDIRARFGLESYYQLDVLLPLDQQVIRLQPPSGQGPAPEFADSFPLTICVPRLPADFPQGDAIRQPVVVRGTFLKLWGFPSEYLESFGEPMLQIAPLLVGVAPRPLPAEMEAPSLGAVLAVLAVLLAVITLGWGAWTMGFGARRPWTNEPRSLPSRPDFSQLTEPADVPAQSSTKPTDS